MGIDFTSSVIAGINPPKFRYWYDGIVQKEIIFPEPHEAPVIKFIPDELIYKDVNNNTQVINFGFDVEITFKYIKLTPSQIRPIIKAFSWRSHEPNRTKIQCIPHTDFPNFNFYGRFVDSFDFRYIDGKFLGHSLSIVFESTEKIHDIPRMTANVIINRKVY